MGIAEAVIFEGGVGGEAVRLVGVAVELGSMKSSMFISSELGSGGAVVVVVVVVVDSRS